MLFWLWQKLGKIIEAARTRARTSKSHWGSERPLPSQLFEPCVEARREHWDDLSPAGGEIVAVMGCPTDQGEQQCVQLNIYLHVFMSSAGCCQSNFQPMPHLLVWLFAKREFHMESKQHFMMSSENVDLASVCLCFPQGVHALHVL